MPRFAGIGERVHRPLYDTVRVTGRQREVLESLRDFAYESWVRPMDVGGKDQSHHSKTLAQLVKKGLAERREGGGHTRNVWRYRATKKGRDHDVALRLKK